MRRYKAPFFASLLCLLLVSFSLHLRAQDKHENIIHYTVNLHQQALNFYSKNEKGDYFKTHGGLKSWLDQKNTELVFAMNGGMYLKDLSPQGLYIENGKVVKQIDTTSHRYGNFYMKPNGVFYVQGNKATIVSSDKFEYNDSIRLATQSGPMLLLDGEFHPKFNEQSENVHIRNGVGILPNGNVLFAISKEEVTFYEFANFFKSMGCLNALYLDGFVSRMYLPSKKWTQTDGLFSIIMAVTKPRTN